MHLLSLAASVGLLVVAVPEHSVMADDERPADPVLTIDRIFDGDEFESKGHSARWLKDEAAYTSLEKAEDFDGRHDIVRHDPATGDRRTLVAAAHLVPTGESKPLKIDGYALSEDRSKVLVYTNATRVWRRNTRGDYWVFDRSSRELQRVGGDARPASLMFAKLSPDGRRVAYVRDGDLYVQHVVDGTIVRLTTADRETLIHGTTDWVYEEEFGLRDGFRWSPDGKSIAYWQIDTEGVGEFPLVDNLAGPYPSVRWFAYPKVGERNPGCRVGVVDCESRETRWVELPGDPRDQYVPRMEWGERPGELVVQQMNRRQNTNRVFLVDGSTGAATLRLTETDDAWVDVHDEMKWIEEGERFTWISERDGWRHVYVVPREGGEPRLVTPGEFDVTRLLHVDEAAGQLWFIASPDDPTRRRLFRVNLDGTGLERITPADRPGTHDYTISSDATWAVHRWSTFDSPPRVELISLPSHETIRVLEDNAKLVERVEALERTPTEFARVDIGDGVELDGWFIKPPDFDPERSYPLLVYVYGEPAGQTVTDRWHGKTYLWHQMLAQRGYVVASFDNRGTKSPRGRDWRKVVYGRIGVLSPAEQAAAVRSVLRERSYLDPARVGIWGWSGGGSSSLHAIFKHPDVYRTAIAIAPVTNQRYYDTIYQERYMGLPEDNVEGYLDGSAINHAKHLEGDLLLIHGTGDDNCHVQTTEMLVDELVAHDKQFDLMIYPNRTHDIDERTNTSRHLRRLMTRFLERTLPAADAREEASGDTGTTGG